MCSIGQVYTTILENKLKTGQHQINLNVRIRQETNLEMSLLGYRSFYKMSLINNMDKVQKQHHLETDPLIRLWILDSHSFGIKNRYKVQTTVTDKGFIFQGTQSNILQTVCSIMNLKKNYKIKGIKSKKQRLKLLDLEGDISILELQKLRDTYPQQTKSIDQKFEFLIIYPKELELKVLEYLEEVISQSFELSLDDCFQLLLMKIFDKIQQNYSCESKMSEVGDKIIFKATGIESTVSSLIVYVKNCLRKYKMKIFLSQKQGNYNKIQIPIIKEKLKKIYFTFDDKKLDKVVQIYKFNLIKTHLQNLKKRYGNSFLGLIYKTSLQQQTQRKVQNLLKQMSPKQQKKQYYKEYKDFAPKSQESVVYSNPFSKPFKSSKSSTQNYAEFPINKMIYQGVQKFNNFKKKINDMSECFQIVIFPNIMNTQQGEKYRLLYDETKDSTKVFQDLNFFFKSYKVRTMSTSLNGVINISQIKRVLNDEVDKSDIFKDVVIDNILVKNMCLTFEMLCGKSQTIEVDQKFQKLIGNLTKQTVRLIEKKQSKY